MNREARAEAHFNCTERDHALFETGIKLGTIYHQFIGIPLDATNVDVVESAIEHAVVIQPFVEEVEVHISRENLRAKRDEYDYQVLSGNMLDVRIAVRVGATRVRAAMRYMEDLRYPLMHIESVEELPLSK